MAPKHQPKALICSRAPNALVRRYFATKEEAALCYSRLRASCVGKEALEAEATAGNRLLLLAGVVEVMEEFGGVGKNLDKKLGQIRSN